MKQLSLPIVIEADADGYFVSGAAGLLQPGAIATKAVENIKDAIRLHVGDRYQEDKR